MDFGHGEAFLKPSPSEQCYKTLSLVSSLREYKVGGLRMLWKKPRVSLFEIVKVCAYALCNK